MHEHNYQQIDETFFFKILIAVRNKETLTLH